YSYKKRNPPQHSGTKRVDEMFLERSVCELVETCGDITPNEGDDDDVHKHAAKRSEKSHWQRRKRLAYSNKSDTRWRDGEKRGEEYSGNEARNYERKMGVSHKRLDDSEPN